VSASASWAIPLTVGVAIFAMILGGVGIYLSLGSDDRGSMGRLLRHPLRTIFAEDRPDPPDDDLR
jgi:hypothetical protein